MFKDIIVGELHLEGLHTKPVKLCFVSLLIWQKKSVYTFRICVLQICINPFPQFSLEAFSLRTLIVSLRTTRRNFDVLSFIKCFFFFFLSTHLSKSAFSHLCIYLLLLQAHKSFDQRGCFGFLVT